MTLGTVTRHEYETPLFHALVSSLHGYCSSLDMVLHVTLTTAITCTSDTQICYTNYWYTNMLHGYTDTLIHWILLHGYSIRYYSMFIPILHRFIGIHALIVPVAWITVYITWLIAKGYSCILIAWLFPVTDSDIPVIGHVSCWYTMCGTKCHVDPSHGGRL